VTLEAKMKRFGLAICLIAAMATGCDDDNPNGPSNPNQVIFTAQMNTANEVPPLSNPAEAGGTATGVITMDLTRDSSGTITAATVNFRASLANLPGGTVLRAAHIHTGAAGVSGGVLIDSGLTPATAITLASGSGNLDLTRTATATEASQIQAIIDNPANFYYNIHSNLNPGGVVRGQLVRQ
jgi:CHRD domain